MSYRTSRTYRSRRRQASQANSTSLVAFLLVAGFGILFAGCTPQDVSLEETADEFAFTEDDVARFREIVMGEGEVGTGSVSTPRLVGTDATAEDADSIVLDLSQVSTYNAIRTESSDDTNMYRVTNEYLNMRSAPSVTADQVERLNQGATMQVEKFVDAAWAKVKLPNGREGYVSNRYIAMLTSEDRLAEQKKKFEGQYFVNFGFLNVRKDPDADSEKLGELAGQSIVRPLSMDDVWARVQFEGKEGYVAVQYLQPFLPNFLVRQENYTVPVLLYNVQREGVADLLIQHIGALQDAGVRIMTFADFTDVLLQQQERDARVDPRSVILAIAGVTSENLKTVSDALRASSVKATIFIQTNQLGIGGITEQNILTMVANGYDVQSGTHTGDDLRSLTNSQITLELKQSRQLLEEQTGREVNAVLYPVGGVNGRVQEIAEEAGYLFGVTDNSQRTYSRDQFLQVPAFSILDTMTAEDVVTIALGANEEESE